MPFLAKKGHEVVGVEGVEKAVVEFRQEQEIRMQEAKWSDGSTIPAFRAFLALSRTQATDLAILVGDFFDLRASMIGGPVDAIWDRGSLVAIPPNAREDYADVVADTLKVGGKCLLVAVEYNQTLKNGPPFSVSRADVEALYLKRGFTVKLLAKRPIEPPRWKLPELYDSVYLLTKMK